VAVLQVGVVHQTDPEDELQAYLEEVVCHVVSLNSLTHLQMVRHITLNDGKNI